MMEKNIVSLVKNSNSRYGNIGYVNTKVIEAVPKLYKFARALDTKKGQWEIYERRFLPHFLEEEQRSSDGFCAVYKRKGKPRTFFIGRLEDVVHLNSTTDVLSQRVLEQRRWFAWPPRNLTAKTGAIYGLNMANAFTMLGIGAFLIDMGISFYGKTTGSFEYESLLDKFVKYAGPEKENLPLMIAGSIVGVLGLIFINNFGFSYIGQKLGKIADKIRIKNLPNKALLFLYGEEAEKVILEDYPIMQEELRKTKLYEKLRGFGVRISKQYFVVLDRAMRTNAKDRVMELLEHLKQSPSELQIPLERLVEVYSEI